MEEGQPLSHALRVSFGTAGEAERGGGRFEAWGGRLWREDVGVPAAGPLAARRRQSELTRPLGDQPLRGVLLRYSDGVADLIVTGQRRHWPEPELRALGAYLLGTGPYPDPPAASADADGWRPSGLAPDWGLGDRRAGDSVAAFRLPLGEASAHGDVASWLAALTVVLARYGGDEPGVAGLLGSGEPVLVPVRPPDDATLGELAATVLASGSLGLADGGEVAVGLVVTGEDQPTTEYCPCPVPVFPLTIAVTADADKFSLDCSYRRRAFDPAVVAQFARHLAEVRRQVIEFPERTVAEAELLDADERDRVAALGRPSRVLRTEPACIHRRVAERALAQPDALALTDDRQRLSYAELDARAKRMAQGLRSLGVRDGDRVGTCLERSAELVVALLAVLKAGAVYVPMDPAYPADRLRYTVEDAGLEVVIGTPDSFPAADGVRVVSPVELASSDPGEAVSSAVGPCDPAYVIYTSGSTGRPKGVVVPHANVIALMDATRSEYQLGPSDVWTLFHSSAFDFSVWEIWGCLLTGGHLVVVPHWVSRSPDDFRALLAAERVTVLSQTPSAFGQLVEVDRLASAADLSVRLVVFGGEPLDPLGLLPWFDRHPESGCRVVNMFGITETTVHVTEETITRRHALERSRAVGPALPGWHLYVMDPAQRMVPPGVAGEIYVGGAGVTPGYLNRPELTSQRFLPDPFTGGRMYRSGDKGRLRPDGKLEHLGRLDSQVKVRGFRIELDEIRSVLLESPGVGAAAVVVNQADSDDAASARIDAYVVPSDGSAGAVRDRVARILPEYMVPATVTALDALPLTTNGKLDVARLPVPCDVPVPVAADPGGGFAGDLLACWTAALGRQVAPDDDFFALGGNSLYAVRVVAAMRERGHPSIAIKDIYRNPTIRRLAAFLGHSVP